MNKVWNVNGCGLWISAREQKIERIRCCCDTEKPMSVKYYRIIMSSSISHSYSVYRWDNRFFWWIFFIRKKKKKFFLCLIKMFYVLYAVYVWVCMSINVKQRERWALNILWLTMCFNIFQRGNDERKFSSLYCCCAAAVA